MPLPPMNWLPAVRHGDEIAVSATVEERFVLHHPVVAGTALDRPPVELDVVRARSAVHRPPVHGEGLVIPETADERADDVGDKVIPPEAAVHGAGRDRVHLVGTVGAVLRAERLLGQRRRRNQYRDQRGDDQERRQPAHGYPPAALAASHGRVGFASGSTRSRRPGCGPCVEASRFSQHLSTHREERLDPVVCGRKATGCDGMSSVALGRSPRTERGPPRWPRDGPLLRQRLPTCSR
jgi:hypothetical protein